MKRMKRKENVAEKPFSLLDELLVNRTKKKPEWSETAKKNYAAIYSFGSKRSLSIFNSFGLPAPSVRTIQRYTSSLPGYDEFGILESSFQTAKDYYSSIEYSGSFIC